LSLFVWGSLFFVRDRSSTKFLNLLGVRTFYHKWVEDETSHILHMDPTHEERERS
jgi:hypothetical protein